LHLDGKNVIDDYKKTRAAGFGREVRRRVMLGTYVLSAGYYDAYYNKANQVRELIKQDYLSVFNHYDAVITPTAPSPAFPIGQNTNDPLQMYLEDIFTVPVNLAGVPAMNVPIGFTPPLSTAPKGLPVGVQITASHRREDILFAFGRLVEKLK
ncbi:MAG: amidase family protein, partial [Candidatus Paceibacterota bacterium]